MVRVIKSPNIMSTTGRMPVMAAPTASPVNPASEIGVSRTLSLPHSSTNPESTLKGVPASATSSPKMHTFESRRISSARASRIACAKVSSRSDVSGIDILIHLIGIRILRGGGKCNRPLHFGLDLGMHPIECLCINQLSLSQRPCQNGDRISFRFPSLFFLLRAVVLAVDVTYVMPVIAIGVTEEESGASAITCPLHESLGNFVHRSHILPIDAGNLQTKGAGSRQDVPRGRFRVMRVFRVE